MRPSTLPTITLLTHLVRAQTNTPNTTCPNQNQLNQTASGSINSTGSVPIHYTAPTSPWYLSTLVNNSNIPSDNGGTIAWPYLSVPRNVSANACVYTFGSQNATATGAGGDACEGVISLECREYLAREMMSASEELGDDGAECRLLPSDSEAARRREDVCRGLGPIGVRAWRNIANESCTYPSLPGVDLPSDYVTHLIGISLSPFNASPGDRWDNYAAMAYDLTVWQSTPYAVVASFEEGNGASQREVEFACVRPGDTQEGSRVVQQAPWDGDSGRGSESQAWRAVPGLKIVVTAAAGALLVI